MELIYCYHSVIVCRPTAEFHFFIKNQAYKEMEGVLNELSLPLLQKVELFACGQLHLLQHATTILAKNTCAKAGQPKQYGYSIKKTHMALTWLLW